MKPGRSLRAGPRISSHADHATDGWLESFRLFWLPALLFCSLSLTGLTAVPAEDALEDQQVDEETAVEEAAIQNNLLLRAFYQQRYTLIFEGTGWEAWNYGTDAKHGFSRSIQGRSRSSHDVFRDNFIARRILDFSGELRLLIAELEESRVGLAAISRRGDLAPGDDQRERLRILHLTENVARVSSEIIQHFQGIVPRLNEDPVQVISDESVRLEGGEILLLMVRRIDDAVRDIRDYFYSSRHVVTADDLKAGDLYSGLEWVKESALVIHRCIERQAADPETAEGDSSSEDALKE